MNMKSLMEVLCGRVSQSRWLGGVVSFAALIQTRLAHVCGFQGKRFHVAPFLLPFSASLPILAVALSVASVFVPTPALAAGFSGEVLSLIWVVPFAGMLLSIALLPLLLPLWWHRHFGKISVFWALTFVIPFAIEFGFGVAVVEVLHVAALEYLPFIVLLLSLFTVSGGIRLQGTLVGTPVINALILVIGIVLASWMGTTGAAMLLIRPLLQANQSRRYKVHTVVFFIFLVANIGGSLTPLGDPPLFLGFLKGVDFFWPLTNMFFPMLVASAAVLAVFVVMDAWLFQKEVRSGSWKGVTGERVPLRVSGSANFLCIAMIVGAVLMSGIWNSGIYLSWPGTEVPLQNILRDIILLAVAYVSYRYISPASRAGNEFDWFPILEVGKLFAGIFVTIIPAVAILRAGDHGSLSWLLALVTGTDGQPNNIAYFWLTGILSSFLDNAPTYLVFFNAAGGDPVQLQGILRETLLAISVGAVFMGANTYIGNAPNFMVRAIAEGSGVRMPSFFGYMVWSTLILVPVFALITVMFFL